MLKKYLLILLLTLGGSGACLAQNHYIITLDENDSGVFEPEWARKIASDMFYYFDSVTNHNKGNNYFTFVVGLSRVSDSVETQCKHEKFGPFQFTTDYRSFSDDFTQKTLQVFANFQVSKLYRRKGWDFDDRTYPKIATLAFLPEIDKSLKGKQIQNTYVVIVRTDKFSFTDEDNVDNDAFCPWIGTARTAAAAAESKLHLTELETASGLKDGYLEFAPFLLTENTDFVENISILDNKLQFDRKTNVSDYISLIPDKNTDTLVRAVMPTDISMDITSVKIVAVVGKNGVRFSNTFPSTKNYNFSKPIHLNNGDSFPLSSLLRESLQLSGSDSLYNLYYATIEYTYLYNNGIYNHIKVRGRKKITFKLAEPLEFKPVFKGAIKLDNAAMLRYAKEKGTVSEMTQEEILNKLTATTRLLIKILIGLLLVIGIAIWYFFVRKKNSKKINLSSYVPIPRIPR